VVGYNVQSVVDTKHHLIVAHEVTNIGNDRAQLARMATAAKAAMGKERLQALADRGYYSGPQIKACTEAKITPLVPKPTTSNAKAEGRFDKADFIYIARDDEFQCPAGERAIHFTTVEHNMTIHKYWSSACPRCPLREKCTTSEYRRIGRWEHEAVLEAMQRRLDGKPKAMTLRRRTIEHVFGTLQALDGLDALPDTSPRACRHRDEPARTRLQLQKVDRNPWYGQDDEGDAARSRLRALVIFRCSRYAANSSGDATQFPHNLIWTPPGLAS
jgi:hypothetical protein